MRVAYFMVEGSSLSWAARLAAEGCDVLLYHLNPDYRHVGEGIVPIAASRDAWLDWGMTDRETLWFFDCTSVPRFDHGALADRLRSAGRLVVGGGTFCDRLENDRTFGETLAKTCGITAPPAHEFSYVSDALAFIRKSKKQQVGDGGWAWKSDRQLAQHGTYVGTPDKLARYLEAMVIPVHGDRIKCILQERVPGVALSTARWWNGIRFTGPFEGTIEHKAFMDGDAGPSTGCAFNAVWFYEESLPKVARLLGWEAIEQQFRARGAPPGIYDVNAVVDRRGAWFLEWTPRLGYDAQLTSQRGYSSLSELLMRLAKGQDIDDLFDLSKLYMSTRLSVPPYPLGKIDVPKSVAMGVPIDGTDGLYERFFVAAGVRRTGEQLEVADPFGFVGVATTADTSIERGYARILDYLKDELFVPDLQYRLDGAEDVMEDIADMARSGFYTTSVLDDDESEAA